MSIFKALLGVAVLPLDIAADIVTLGGVCTDKDKPYTAKRIEGVFKNIDKATR